MPKTLYEGLRSNLNGLALKVLLKRNGDVPLWNEAYRNPRGFLHRGDVRRPRHRWSPGSPRASELGRKIRFRRTTTRAASAGIGLSTISSAGGTEPRWRGDGKELFFIDADGSMMATSVSADTGGAKPEFRPGSSRQLFDTHVRTLSEIRPVWSYDVTSDGTRFLLASPIDSSTALNVVVNWAADTNTG